ncbi:MAG: UDP-glucose 4-epimerase GalE, partial [Methanomassiliicoccaceae archaeon]|nr:UDP-glucose 4-epimerase GalE [Methanomassiliicoccaceae archaeon]
MRILVTGGIGYIGSQCVIALMDKGFDVLVLDNFRTGRTEIADALRNVKAQGKLLGIVKADLEDKDSLKDVFSSDYIDAVLHLAAVSQVEESMKYPDKYYRNNVAGTLNLLGAMLNANVKKIVFSSTAAVYGEPEYVPIDEEHPLNPINPYGSSKKETEKAMDELSDTRGLRSVRLRYFNVAGADTKCRVGEWHDPETHLIPNILKSTFGGGEPFKLFGNDYDTKDGTCVRDYVNVEDLADAHILA